MEAASRPRTEAGERPQPKGLPAGTRIGNVVVERELGRGGFAVVRFASCDRESPDFVKTYAAPAKPGSPAHRALST